jgi:hypothetical protein
VIPPWLGHKSRAVTEPIGVCIDCGPMPPRVLRADERRNQAFGRFFGTTLAKAGVQARPRWAGAKTPAVGPSNLDD